MEISDKIEYAAVDDLFLDPKNPRLGRHFAVSAPLQGAVLERMSNWELDELATSIGENGFWPQEPLVAVKEQLEARSRLVVIEGNRRLATLKLIQLATTGKNEVPGWARDVVKEHPEVAAVLKKIPYVIAKSREAVAAYLGFRHVTGIKEWHPAEKAEFIASLIERGLTYEQVSRQIGSKTPSVRKNYISHRITIQLENEETSIRPEDVDDRFSVLYLSLRTRGVQTFLSIDVDATPAKAKTPVPPDHVENLVKFAVWLFGTPKRKPVLPDSRDVDRFGKILESKDAITYLEKNETPDFERAYRLAGGGEQEISELVEQAVFSVENALSTAHLHAKSERLEKATDRLARGTLRLLDLFPKTKASLLP